MKSPCLPAAILTILSLSTVFAPVGFATCGGGGGGGRGGAVPRSNMGGGSASSSDGGSSPSASGIGGGDAASDIYRVPWILANPGKEYGAGADAVLFVLWFPATPESALSSRLHASRVLTQANERCVLPVMVPLENKDLRARYKVAHQEVALFVAPDGTELKRVTARGDGVFYPHDAEQTLQAEIDRREKELGTLLAGAQIRAKAGDKTAADDLQKIWAQRCLFPSLGKKAAKTLKKLGIEVAQADLEHLGADTLADADVHDVNSTVEPLLKQGLEAELAGKFRVAEGFYRQASEVDPADTTALRYLGELYRHETGEWDKAGRVFNQILMQPSDRIARAVALHGLGKMTIHAGRYTAGLALFEKSIATYPLPITYRNLAVYWFSEKQEETAAGYMRQALALDTEDTYNQIFAAVYLAAAGHKEEAAKIARANESVLEASYNLAAIWAQVGNRDKAMELLRRQFYTYESYSAVRSMEMKEARDDYQFASIRNDPEFIELTKLAKSAYLIGAEWCSPEQLSAQPVYTAPMSGAERKG